MFKHEKAKRSKRKRNMERERWEKKASKKERDTKKEIDIERETSQKYEQGDCRTGMRNVDKAVRVEDMLALTDREKEPKSLGRARFEQAMKIQLDLAK